MEFNPFTPGDFAEKCVLKLVEWFSGHSTRMSTIQSRTPEKKAKNYVTLT